MLDNINPEDFILKEENKDYFKKSLIERQNVTTEFTLEDIEAHQADLKKMERELKAQFKVTGATIDNIERNHPFVKDFDKEQLHHIWMYHENKVLMENAEQKYEQVKEQLTAYKELLEVLYEKFGFVKSGEAVSINSDELGEDDTEE
jgi:hypothetical protein